MGQAIDITLCDAMVPSGSLDRSQLSTIDPLFQCRITDVQNASCIAELQQFHAKPLYAIIYSSVVPSLKYVLRLFLDHRGVHGLPDWCRRIAKPQSGKSGRFLGGRRVVKNKSYLRHDASDMG